MIVLEWNIFQKKLENLLGIKKLLQIFIEQSYDSIMCRYFCIGFIDFILKSASLLEYTNLFSPDKYKKNDKILLKYFQ